MDPATASGGSSSNNVSRIASAALCAIAASAVGFAQPWVWYYVWSVTHPDRGGQDWSALAAIALGTIGAIGGAVVGLLVGALAPKGSRMSLSFAGLAVVQVVAVAYFFSVSPERALWAWIAIPSIAVEVMLALLCWRRRPATR